MACTVYGECVPLLPAIAEIACCETCKDYDAAMVDESSGFVPIPAASLPSRLPVERRDGDQWRKGFGSRLHRFLGRLGVTPPRVARFLRRPCKCHERMDCLDRISLRMVRLWRWVWGW